MGRTGKPRAGIDVSGKSDASNRASAGGCGNAFTFQVGSAAERRAMSRDHDFGEIVLQAASSDPFDPWLKSVSSCPSALSL